MNFLDKMERKFGRYAIPNLSMWLIVGYLIGYVCYYVPFLRPVLTFCMLDPAAVMHGQVWRLITWVIMPPSYSNILFYAIMLLLYYQLGSALERNWGSFRFNVYIIGGVIFTAVGVMILYAVLWAIGSPEVLYMGRFVSTNYINMAIFLAFAMCYPDLQLMLYFIIPIKMKWMAIFYAALIAIDFFSSTWTGRIVILMSLANFLIFFFSSRNFKRMTPHEVKRRRDFKRGVRQPQMRRADGQLYKHKCAICGRTELDDPTLEFRFCSKCEGYYEYCQEHLFTHRHIKRN